MADVPFVSLYRRFRPGRFDELRGQDHVVQALRNAVRDDRVSHAYLFSGPRGTGKTSSARILAKALNCAAPVDGEPCGVCTSCKEITQGTSLDVHELDAASNNGVDAMRDLVAHAALGTPGRWKVYIVDEVHMLSTAAANALLKTLEEPPGHVVFVLATTDPQKVPPTIRSRTQHLEFRLLGAEVLHDLLDSVNQQAGLAMDEESVQAAVRRGRGSARDALSALDQVAASGSADSARPELGTVLTAVADSDAVTVLVTLGELLARGWGPPQLATELVDDLRQSFLAALAPELCAISGAGRAAFTTLAESMGLPRLVRAMEVLGQALIDMRDAPDPQVVLEIALVRSARPDLDAGIDALTERVAALERALAPGQGERPAPPAPRPESGAPMTPVQTSAPPDGVGRRPSVGAIRRRQDTASATETGTDAGTADPGTPDVATPDTGTPDTGTPDAGTDVAAPAPGVADPPSTPSPTDEPGAAVDRDAVTQAWGDGILRNLSARAKALYSGGRFVAVDEAGVSFALPNAAHRDRCAELAPLVEGALTQHFGTPIHLVLVVDGGVEVPAPPTGAPAGGSTHLPSPEDPEGAEEVDLEEIRAATSTSTDTDQASAAEARLLEAFPGTSEVGT
jgi:DNA polymerase-3 subunit gamma/tau